MIGIVCAVEWYDTETAEAGRVYFIVVVSFLDYFLHGMDLFVGIWMIAAFGSFFILTIEMFLAFEAKFVGKCWRSWDFRLA